MSIITAKIYRDKKKVIFASDSLALYGEQKTKSKKLFEIYKNFFYIGTTGSVTDKNFLCYYIKNLFDLDLYNNNKYCNDELFLHKLFIEASKKVIDDKLVINDKPNILNFNMLVYFNKKLYQIYTYIEKEFSIEINLLNKDYMAVGRGEEYVLCAMYLGKSPEEAIKIANEFSYYIDNDIKKIEFYYE